MRDERESEIASKFKYGMVGWIENRMRLWRLRRADLADARRAAQIAGVRYAAILAAHHTRMHAPHGPAVDARTDGPVMRRSDASQSGGA